jgi:hypothetical protein
MKRFLLSSIFAVVSFSAVAQSSNQPSPTAINTGGPSGAYHSTFCPPLPRVLSNAYFQGYNCTPSAGTIQNIERVLAQPSNIGFAQLDVFARESLTRPQDFQRLSIIRADIACEGLWMVTRNNDLDFGQILGLARRIKFVLPAQGSGSTASFNYLRSIDPEGLGRISDSNVTHLQDATAVIRHIANSTQGEVGFFVQFADPRNANIRLIVENNLRVIPVISREILRAKVNDQSVYQVQSFNLSHGGFFGIGGRAQTVTTACTPVAIFTGSPSNFTDRNSQEDARDLVERIRQVPHENILPQDSTLASIIRNATRLSQSAIDQAIDGVERARQAVEQR